MLSCRGNLHHLFFKYLYFTYSYIFHLSNSGEYPIWAQLIQNAVEWRNQQWNDKTIDDDLTYDETVRFVQFIIETIEGHETMSH